MILVWFSAICFGTYTTTSSEYKTPVIKTALNFSATYANGKVSTSWKNIDVVTNTPMKWYKVIKSTTVTSPVYPDNWYIQAISDRTQTSFVETNPENGTWYYRVCAIMEDMNRYCSNVVTLTINNTTATTTTPATTNTTTTTSILTASLKTMIEWLVTAFMTKVDAKYPNNIASKITFLETLIGKIDTLSTGKYGYLFVYLGEKLEEQVAILKLQSALTI